MSPTPSPNLPIVVACCQLDCTDCSFQASVDGDFDAVWAEIEAHQAEQEAGPTAHFVTVHRREYPPERFDWEDT